MITGGLGAATPAKTRKITLDPIVIQGKVPGAATAKASSWQVPWKWVIATVAVGGAWWWAKRKGAGHSLRPLAG